MAMSNQRPYFPEWGDTRFFEAPKPWDATETVQSKLLHTQVSPSRGRGYRFRERFETWRDGPWMREHTPLHIPTFVCLTPLERRNPIKYLGVPAPQYYLTLADKRRRMREWCRLLFGMNAEQRTEVERLMALTRGRILALVNNPEISRTPRFDSLRHRIYTEYEQAVRAVAGGEVVPCLLCGEPGCCGSCWDEPQTQQAQEATASHAAS